MLERFESWKVAMESNWLKVNIEKTKVLVSGKEWETAVSSGEYPRGVCNREVGRNSVLCTKCGKWTHLRCSGLQNVNQAREFEFVCATCTRW